MEHDYISNPAIKLCCERIEPNSTEKEVQTLWENIVWTAFPAADNWMNQTKYKQGATEPDNKVMKLIHYNAGWAPVDVLVIELKRPREDISLKTFNRVANDLLDDHMAESTNPIGTTLFGAVGIGTHAQFYRRILPRGNLNTMHSQPLHIETDAKAVQGFFDYFKENIPKASSAAPVTSGLAHLSMGSIPHEGASSSAGSILDTPSSYGAGTSMALAGPSEAGLPEQYYYVRDQLYFFYDRGSHISQPSRPKNVWVLNENGWNDTSRTKKWRFWDGKNVSYE